MSITLIRVKGADPEKNVEERNDLEVPVSLPAVLGRGALLKCAEKKVSRRHAYLDWDDDGVLITSVHQNPTYVVANGQEKELTEGDSTLLSHGDRFGLMKTTFWFKILIPSSVPKDKGETKAEEVSNFENTSEESTKQVAVIENGTEDPLPVCESKDVTDCSSEKNVKPPFENITEVEEIPAEQEKSECSHAPEWERNGDEFVKKERPKKQDDDKDNNISVENYTTTAKVTAQEIKLAVSSRKRELPEWFSSTDILKNKGNPSESDNMHCHGSSRKTMPAASKRKKPEKCADNNRSAMNQANEESSDTHHSSTNQAVGADTAELNNAKSPRKQENVKRGCVTPKKNNQNSSPRKAKGLAKNGTSPRKKAAKSHHDLSDESSDEDLQSITTPNQRNKNDDGNMDRLKQTPQKQHQSPAQHLPLRKQHDFSDDEEEDVIDETTSSAASTNTSAPLPAVTKGAPLALPQRKVPRKSCQYGANCYRKNPQHRLQFAHSGDPDYRENTSESEDPSDERPECEYGVNCYRKNPGHRQNYRHSRVPQPQRKAKRRARRQKQEAENDSDEYDYDDPFLNDDSSDDYAPTDSGSDSAMELEAEEEEDTTRMMKEARKFVRKKKV